ncbi:hypothetical protein MKW92_016384 [Papaver armeniacum]|nr:hypothetical protein MKW92_016384 [Papaver armeniacum]
MQQFGINSMLKQGHQHFSGLDEAVMNNIDGMNKMVIDHWDKLFVTNDASTIVNELEVQHPAAKLLVLAAKAQRRKLEMKLTSLYHLLWRDSPEGRGVNQNWTAPERNHQRIHEWDQ